MDIFFGFIGFCVAVWLFVMFGIPVIRLIFALAFTALTSPWFWFSLLVFAIGFVIARSMP